MLGAKNNARTTALASVRKQPFPNNSTQPPQAGFIPWMPNRSCQDGTGLAPPTVQYSWRLIFNPALKAFGVWTVSPVRSTYRNGSSLRPYRNFFIPFFFDSCYASCVSNLDSKGAFFHGMDHPSARRD